MKEFRHITEDFFIGNLGSKETTDEIVEGIAENFNFKSINYEDAGVGTEDDPPVDHRIRKCLLKWISVNPTNYVESGLRKIIEYVNDGYFNIPVEHKWETDIQYTKYKDKGHFFGWHSDSYDGDNLPIRKLSIVYSLCHKNDYVGGEFQIKTSNGEIYTRKFDYGDFIVFPSDKVHRVKKLKGGERTTLVGWYY